MSRWWKGLEEEPSQALEQKILQQVEPELAELRRQNRRELFRRWLMILVPTSAVAGLTVWLRQRQPSEPVHLEEDLVDLALGGEDNPDLEEIAELEDLDLLEDLEDLEKWTS